MKKLFISASLFVIPVLLFVSCRKDLGNYDYLPDNGIRISIDMANTDPRFVITEDSLVVRQNDTLQLKIVLSQANPSTDLSYQWSIIQSASDRPNPSQDVIATTRDLSSRITVTPGLYQLVIRVTDNTNGVGYFKFYKLMVDAAPWAGEGWLVLQDQSAKGGADISMIATRDGSQHGTTYHDVYYLANNHKLPTGTNKMAVMNYNSTLGVQKISFIYPNGGVQVRSIDYTDSSDHINWFLMTPSSYDIQSNGVAPTTGQHEYIINKGQLYTQAVNTVSLRTPPIKFGAPFLGSWTELSPFVMTASSDAYMTLFDKASRSFLLLKVDNGTLVPATQPDQPNNHFTPYKGIAADLDPQTGKGFDMNNIRLDFVHAELAQTITSTSTMYDCLFRNSTGDSTFLLQFPVGLGYANDFKTGKYFLDETKVPGINSASVFAVPTHLALPGGAFYYVHGTSNNSIYVCNPSYTGTLPSTTTAHEGYRFPEGTVIRTMKVFKSGYKTTALPEREGKVLVVATDETAIGNGNNVYFFNLTPSGEIEQVPADVYTGFDTIVDIAFKKGLGL